MNKAIMMGRLTKDPETRYTNGGKTIGKFSLAVDRRFKQEGQPDADFFNCVTFGKQAEFVEKFLHKGTKILISGQVQNNNYTNKDGQTVYSTQILIDEIEFAESKGAQAQQQPSESNSGQQEWMNIPEGLVEELPFK